MPATRRFAVVGHPIAHSRSPEIFAALSTASGIALTYERVEIAPSDFAAAFAHARATYDGWNVTAPHKARAIAAADHVTAHAGMVGAANVIVFRDGRATAANTDVEGVTALLAHAGADPRGAHVTVLGAGGAARASVLALAHGGAASITVSNRTSGHAHTLIDELRDAVGTTALHAGHVDRRSTILINATSNGAAVASAVDAIAPGAVCIDLQYRPRDTPFVLAGRAAGHHAVNGTPMLVAQAIATFRIWFGDVALGGDVITRLTALVEAS